MTRPYPIRGAEFGTPEFTGYKFRIFAILAGDHLAIQCQSVGLILPGRWFLAESGSINTGSLMYGVWSPHPTHCQKLPVEVVLIQAHV